MTDFETALLAIERSNLSYFSSPLEWAQWCQDIAIAAGDGDTEKVQRLAAKVAAHWFLTEWYT